MSFSLFQWLIFIGLDLLIKIGCVYLIFEDISRGAPLPLPTVVFPAAALWMFHLLFLGMARGLLAFFKRKNHANVAVTLLIGEALFAIIVVLSLLEYLPSPDFSEKGITVGETEAAMWIAFFLLAINLVPTPISMGLGALASLVKRVLRKDQEVRSGEAVKAQDFYGRSLLLLVTSLPIIVVAGWFAGSAYRKNSCGPGDHVIQSAEDAITVAKKKMVKERKFNSESFGSALDFVDSLAGIKDCCYANRSRNTSFVIVWEVSLSNSAKGRNYRAATLYLANCGDIFTGDSYIDSGY
jgi:hypothetical protein